FPWPCTIALVLDRRRWLCHIDRIGRWETILKPFLQRLFEALSFGDFLPLLPFLDRLVLHHGFIRDSHGISPSMLPIAPTPRSAIAFRDDTLRLWATVGRDRPSPAGSRFTARTVAHTILPWGDVQISRRTIGHRACATGGGGFLFPTPAQIPPPSSATSTSASPPPTSRRRWSTTSTKKPRARTSTLTTRRGVRAAMSCWWWSARSGSRPTRRDIPESSKPTIQCGSRSKRRSPQGRLSFRSWSRAPRFPKRRICPRALNSFRRWPEPGSMSR